MTKPLATMSIAVCCVLAGCATAQLTREQVDGMIVCNAEQMDQVERQARRNFTELHWLNCPTVKLRVVSADGATTTR